MKVLSLITILSVCIPQLTRADNIRRRTRTRSDPSSVLGGKTRNVTTTGRPDDSQRQCESMGTEDQCSLIDRCKWNDSQCKPINEAINEGCGIARDESACEAFEAFMNCVWIFDDDRPDSSGRCTEKCATPESKSDCNSVKGCGWVNDGDSTYCSVAPTQLVCDDFQDKQTCKYSGCRFDRKRNECISRWEHGFLSTTKGMDGNDAKKAIEDEFGVDTYVVVLVYPGENRLHRREDPTRIKLFLDDGGLVKKTPRFG